MIRDNMEIICYNSYIAVIHGRGIAAAAMIASGNFCRTCGQREGAEKAK